MIERRPEQHILLEEAVDEIREFKPEMEKAGAVLIVIEDQHVKADALLDQVQSPYSPLNALSIATLHSLSAGEGIALVKMYLTSQDLANETPEEAKAFPPLVIAMDGSLPFRRGINSRTSRDMGFQAAQNIVKFCLDGEGDKDNPYPIPYFIGFSTDFDTNDNIRKLLEENNAGDRYLGDYWHGGRDTVINNLKTLSTPPQPQINQ